MLSHRSRSNRKPLSFLLLIALLLAGLIMATGPAATTVHASPLDDKLDDALLAQLNIVPPTTPLEVVIVFSDTSAAPLVGSLASTFYQMQALPMAGAILTAAQIQAIAAWPQIHSITLNTPLEYFLHESVEVINANDVWTSYGQQGSNAVVAVIDSGIDATHSDLPFGSTKVIQNVKVLPFAVAVENVPLTDTSSGHGTHVAGIIAGNGSFSSGYYRGVAPAAKLVGLGAGELITILTATQAYDWVLQHHQQYNIRVVSNSWGITGGNFDPQNPVVMATYQAYQAGILTLFAAGNDGGYDVLNPYSLAPWVISVAAGDNNYNLADFSSRGRTGDAYKHPDITAPGVNIYSARSSTIGITALDPLPNPINPLWTARYTMMSGTSMATPHVAGAAALLLSNKPQLSPDQLINLLLNTADPMPGYQLHEAGNGYLDVLAAYQSSLTTTGNLPAFLAGDRDH